MKRNTITPKHVPSLKALLVMQFMQIEKQNDRTAMFVSVPHKVDFNKGQEIVTLITFMVVV